MFKPVYAPSGVLITAVSALANIFAISSNLYAHLSAVLGEAGSDYTYLLVTDGVNAEVVKVTQLNAGLATVVRDASSEAFGAGTSVTAIIPAEAISDMIDSAIADASLPASLTFAINDPHTVEEVAGVVTINVEKMPLTSPNSTIDISVVGDGYGIDVERGAFGCCPDE